MHQEIPFQTAVDIERFEEFDDGVEIEAVFWSAANATNRC